MVQPALVPGIWYLVWSALSFPTTDGRRNLSSIPSKSRTFSPSVIPNQISSDTPVVAMTMQQEEVPSVDVHKDDDSIGQESFHTCGNDQNAKSENQQKTSKPLNLGETTAADTIANVDQNTTIRVNPSILGLEKEKTPKKSVGGAIRIPSFIQVGLEKKQSARAIKSWAALALTLDGRDKITKVIQYTSRFLGWYLAGGTFKTQSVRFTALYKALANARKGFRLGRSLIEYEKLRPVPGMILWHLQSEEDRELASSEPKKFLTHQASSNTGLGPSTIVEEQESRRSLLHSLGSVAYQGMYRPLLSRMSSTMLPDDAPTQELWKICGTSIKILGLLFFWAGDNCNFLLSTGAFDDYNYPMEKRLKRRKQRQTYVSSKAAQAYFVGSLSGLLVNWYAYLKFHRESIAGLQNEDNDVCYRNSENWALKVKQLKQKQFSLLLSLLKVRCVRRG